MEGIAIIGIGLACIGAMGAAIGIGLIYSAVATGISRNPEAEGQIKKAAIIGAVFAELLGLASIGLGFAALFAG